MVIMEHYVTSHWNGDGQDIIRWNDLESLTFLRLSDQPPM